MIKNYFKIAWRNIRKRKSVALINILGLALGFSCAILIFLFIQFHLTFDNFHKDSDRIYRFVSEVHRDHIAYKSTVPPALPNVFKNDYNYAEKVAKIIDRGEQLITVNSGATPQRYKPRTAFVEPDFFRIFNFPLIDKDFSDELTAPNTAIITREMAKKLFGDTSPINQTFIWDNKDTIRVTGVLKDLPKNTLINSRVFISFKTLQTSDRTSWIATESWTGTATSLQCFTLLRLNQDPLKIEQEMKKWPAKYHPEPVSTEDHYKLQPFPDIHFDSRYSNSINIKLLWILGAIGFFLILIACINFINISAAQSVYRSKEVGVRKVLGSFKDQLFRQFLTETFLITLIALIIGFGLSVLFLPFFNNTFNLSLSKNGLINFRFAGFIAILLIGVAILAGSYPGIILARIAPVLALKRKLTQSDTGSSLTRKILVTSQFVISIVLIIAVLVIGKQIKYATSSDLGYDTSTIVMVGLPETLEQAQLNTLKNKIVQSSNIKRVSICFTSPGAQTDGWGTDVNFNGNPKYEKFLIQSKMGDEDYIETFGIQLVAGRNFIKKDSVDEVLVNETFGTKIGINSPEELLGKPIKISDDYIQGRIVGVVKDFYNQDFHGTISPVFIAPAPDLWYNEIGVKINRKNTKEALQHIEQQWTSYFPNFIFEYAFLNDRVTEMYKSEQQFLSLTRLFSFLAIFIDGLGIYGLVSFFVAQKTKEVGIRKVLGGRVIDILGLFFKDFFTLIGIAGLIASPIAWYFMNDWLQHYAYRTQINWWVFALPIGCVLVLTLLIASYKGYRAATANPVKSLRSE
ncbi:ABC-type antimicrobial peptide transport system, permease component [Sinomicrobium oceani]|uniref:ABC-type antimicrobial peptide transport system, permease component n=1 Tax=Sinomicrobium oceani TaxID=1150368 RepID=A0A1K1LQP6_9FLAO|nr:ABC transporter permease [Sinomicrobium oceani]SFW13192.1 ABC-type antimicrobial peptide transport system, permease component [Sinomicrobium oceani]